MKAKKKLCKQYIKNRRFEINDSISNTENLYYDNLAKKN